MSSHARFAVGIAVVLVLVGTSYIMSGESIAEAHLPMSMTTQMNINALAPDTKNLPVQQFDAI